MNRFSSKRIAVKVNFIGPENILCAGASLHLSARNIYNEGVKFAMCGINYSFRFFVCTPKPRRFRFDDGFRPQKPYGLLASGELGH